MKKEEILNRLSDLSEEELNCIVDTFRKHRPKKENLGMQVINVPEHVTKRLSGLGGDLDLLHIINSLPTCLTAVEEPTAKLVEKCKRIYTENCFCFDEIGELFVQKVLEYSSSYQTRPLIMHGPPGCGKSHRARVLALMLGLPYERADIPLATYGAGLTGTDGSYKNSSTGIIINGMLATGSCNYILNSEELDKEARLEGRPSFSDQFLKVLDQDSSRFRDNRLGFDVDASHIVYVFTANDKSKISAPMLDRCDVVELAALCRIDIERIVRGSLIPASIKGLCSSAEISFSEEAVEYIVGALWRGENTSIRQYQTLISRCAGAANYTGICEERPVVIEASDAELQLRRMSPASSIKNRIGFV